MEGLLSAFLFLLNFTSSGTLNATDSTTPVDGKATIDLELIDEARVQWQIPAGVTKLSVLAVGGGGAGAIGAGNGGGGGRNAAVVGHQASSGGSSNMRISISRSIWTCLRCLMGLSDISTSTTPGGSTHLWAI